MPDSDVQLLLADLALIIILARLLGMVAKRIGQPPVLGEIVAGIMLGPTIWGTTITAKLFPATLIPPLTALADLGLVLFMFVVGYEVDLGLVKGRGRTAAGVAVGSIAVPLVLGAGLGVWFAHRYHVPDPVTFVLFFGTAMSITAFPVLARILTDRGLHRTRVGGLALAAASLDDVLAWALLAVVIAVAGAGSGQGQFRLLLAPVYAAVMIWLVKPALRWLAEVYQRQGRLTPNVLAAVLALLLLSSFATDWMGVKFIFGAFIFGIVMPRDIPALREAILERLEQVSVLVLLPVFFVVAGLNVNLRGIGVSGLVDLLLIMLVAVAGKFGGAYYGARLTGVRRRQAGALASLMNTRGLTEIVILTVGLQLGILNKELFTLMVVMAVVTTGMAGPLLKVIYPDRIMERDIAEADRASLGRVAAHRILVLIEDPATAGPLIDVGARLAASRPHSELVLSHLVEHRPRPAGGRFRPGRRAAADDPDDEQAQGSGCRGGAGWRGRDGAVQVQRRRRRGVARVRGGCRARHDRAPARQRRPRSAQQRRSGPAGLRAPAAACRARGCGRSLGPQRRRRRRRSGGRATVGGRPVRSRAAIRQAGRVAGSRPDQARARGPGGRAAEGRDRHRAGRRGLGRPGCARPAATAMCTWPSWRARTRQATIWISGSRHWTPALTGPANPTRTAPEPRAPATTAAGRRAGSREY